MINVIKREAMGRSELGWLHSQFHFSFAEYYNPENMQFGALRVVNDDLFEPQGGFPTHPHKNMEIVSYVVDGTLTHKDSLGNGHTLKRGEVQYMSAGTGITHSEFNYSPTASRFLQIWILPDANGYQPNYGDMRYAWDERVGKWLTIASGTEGRSPVIIHQDMDLSVTHLEAGEELVYDILPGRQAYVIQIEGESELNGNVLPERSAAEVTEETQLNFKAKTASHLILFDMVAA